MTTLHTERLTLRPMSTDDMQDMFEIYSNEAAMRFMHVAPHQSVSDTMHQIVNDLSPDGTVLWAICLKGENKVIGQVNFLGQTRISGMGYILHPDYWGKGYVPEAARAVLDFGFENLDFDRVELWIDESNHASSRVAQKLGFIPRGRLPMRYSHRGQHHFMTVWGMYKSDWQADSQYSDSAETQFYSAEPVLKVHDVLESAAFYRDKLGFNLDFMYGDPTYYAIVSRGEWSGNMVAIHLSQIDAKTEIQPSCNLHIRVGETIDALFEQYRNQGVTIIDEPENKPWGLREFVIKDLDGHVLVFASYKRD